VGVEAEGLAAGGDGIIELAGQGQEEGEVGVVDGIAWLDGDGAADEREGVGQAADLASEEAEQVEGAGIVGVLREDSAVGALGEGELAGLVVLEAGLEGLIEGGHGRVLYASVGSGGWRPGAAVAEAEELVGVGGGVGEEEVEAVEFGVVVDGAFFVAEVLHDGGDDGVVVDDEDVVIGGGVIGDVFDEVGGFVLDGLGVGEGWRTCGAGFGAVREWGFGREVESGGEGGGGLLSAEGGGGDDAGDASALEGGDEFLGTGGAAGEEWGGVAEAGFFFGGDVGVSDDDEGVGVDEGEGSGGLRVNSGGRGSEVGAGREVACGQEKGETCEGEEAFHECSGILVVYLGG